jgi:hypothetical protein
MLEQGTLHPGGRTAQMEPQQQPTAGHSGHADLQRALGQIVADPHRIRDETLPLDHGDVRQRRRAGHRTAPESAAQVADADGTSDLRGGDNRSDRQPGCEALGKGEQIGSHPERLRSAERAAASNPALDLVENECGAAIGADPARGAEKLGRAVASAGEALHRLHDYGRHGLVHRRIERGNIVERHLAREWNPTAPRGLLVLRPVGAGESGRGAAMPSSPHRHHCLPAGMPARKVERVLIGFGAGVTQKHPCQRSGTELGQLFGQRFPGRVRHRG